jgi:hypothetical protein
MPEISRFYGIVIRMYFGDRSTESILSPDSVAPSGRCASGRGCSAVPRSQSPFPWTLKDSNR